MPNLNKIFGLDEIASELKQAEARSAFDEDFAALPEEHKIASVVLTLAQRMCEQLALPVAELMNDPQSTRYMNRRTILLAAMLASRCFPPFLYGRDTAWLTEDALECTKHVEHLAKFLTEALAARSRGAEPGVRSTKSGVKVYTLKPAAGAAKRGDKPCSE